MSDNQSDHHPSEGGLPVLGFGRPSDDDEEEEEEEEEEEDDDEHIGIDDLSDLTRAALLEHLALASRDKEGVLGLEVREDYGLSQFWYDDDTATALAKEVVARSEGGMIAILSAPSVMGPLKDHPPETVSRVALFEYDERFGVLYPDNFHKYDFNEPDDVPSHLLSTCDAIILDPPYLNMETLGMFIQSAQHLARHPLLPNEPPAPGNDQQLTPLIVITAASLAEPIRTSFGLRPTTFPIRHSSKLSNPMYCYTNYRPLSSSSSHDHHLGLWFERSPN